MIARVGLLGAILSVTALSAGADDWPQWRGPNRDNKVTGFTVPTAWPKALKQQWKVKVGDGVASPVLVGDKLYVFTLEGSDEVVRCLAAADGKEVWAEKYPTTKVGGAASGYPGPRGTPAVGGGKVCTLGVGNVLSCFDAATGKLAWRKDPKVFPSFNAALSPLVADGVCIAHLGGGGGFKMKGGGKGDIAAYDLATGNAKWKWDGAGPGHASPVLLTAGGTKQVVCMTDSNVVGLDFASGKELWKKSFKAKYNCVTPVVNGDTVIYAGAGTGSIAVKVEKSGDGFTAKDVWKSDIGPANYNTPVVKGDHLYGLSSSGKGSTKIFCQELKTGDGLWTDTVSRGECGAILDVGPVLIGLSSSSELLVFKPSAKSYEEVAKYKVSDTPTWCVPILAGNRIFVKDRDSVILWTVE